MKKFIKNINSLLLKSNNKKSTTPFSTTLIKLLGENDSPSSPLYLPLEPTRPLLYSNVEFYHDINLKIDEKKYFLSNEDVILKKLENNSKIPTSINTKLNIESDEYFTDGPYDSDGNPYNNSDDELPNSFSNFKI